TTCRRLPPGAAHQTAVPRPPRRADPARAGAPTGGAGAPAGSARTDSGCADRVVAVLHLVGIHLLDAVADEPPVPEGIADDTGPLAVERVLRRSDQGGARGDRPVDERVRVVDVDVEGRAARCLRVRRGAAGLGVPRGRREGRAV